MKNRKILVVDDDRAMCASLKLLLAKAGYEPIVVNHPREITEVLLQYAIDLVLLDMNFAIETSGRKGLEALKEIKKRDQQVPVILMTGWATVQLAVEGMKLGAADFIAKPWDNKHLLESIRTLLVLRERESPKQSFNFEHIIGEDDAILEILETIKTVADTKANVLVLGESGTGKEVIAEALHYSSSRKNRPFVKVNLGGLSTSLFESELFGHRKGAFTDASTDRTGRFELADSGTIFLDEIGDLDINAQVKLLRVLQESTFEPLGSSKSMKVDVRVIAATNKNLEEMVMSGDFREDLFYRLNLVTITLPPLRDRPGDIPLLAQHFVNIYQDLYEKEEVAIDKKALRWLSQQQFQGNIRQLKNLIEKCIILSLRGEIGLDLVQTHYRDLDKKSTVLLPEIGSISLEDLEKQMVLKALQKYDNKVADAAKALGLTRSSLYRRIEKYNIPL